MLDNNKQIAVCLIIDKNKDNALILLEQIKSVFYVDRIFVIYNNNLDLGIKDDYIKIKVLKNDQYGNIIKTKNKALKYCYQNNIQYVFLVNDNIQIKDIFVMKYYITTAIKNDLNFMSFNNSKVYNIEDVDIHNKLSDDFIFLTRQALKFAGYFDEKLNQSNYLEEYYIRLLGKEAVQPCVYSFPDIQRFNECLQIIDSKNRQVSWDFLKQKIENVEEVLNFNKSSIDSYYSYKKISSKIRNKKQYKTVACLIAKNQNQYLDEWIQYYYQLGFDEIIIYENNCKIKLKYQYPCVSIIQWNFQKKQQQQNAYIHCMREVGPYVDFIAFFDADEFLYIKDGVSLQEFLREYSDCFGIAINWRLFGNNGLTKVQNNNYQVLTRFTKCGKDLKEEVKLILNCQLIRQLSDFNKVVFHSSHYINFPVSLTDKSYHIGPLNKNIQNSDQYTAQVYHYPLKTMEEFLMFKQNRGRADIIVQDDSYKTEQYWNQLNKNQIQNFNIANALDRNVNSHYAEFNLITGEQEYIKFEHIDRFKFQNLILNMFKIKRVEQCNKQPLVTVSILPPKDINNWQTQILKQRPYIIHTKIENNKLYFHIQIVKQSEEEVYKFNCIFTFIWKMLFTSMIVNYDCLVLHGIMLKNGNVIIGPSGCGKTTLAQRLSIDDGSLVVCDDNILVTFKDGKLIAQPLPMLPYVKKGRQFKWTNIDFNIQIEVKNILCLSKDDIQSIKQIDETDWKRIFFYSCLILIYQPFAQRNEIYNINFDKWIECRKGLKEFIQKRMMELIQRIQVKKSLLITTNTKDITKNINKQLKDFLSLS